VKFTEHGTVVVRLVSDPMSAAPLCVEVQDTGVGIPPDRIDAVFEAFQQADNSTSRQFGGTGLGLTITRSLARCMGFDVQVQSTVGVGSLFSIALSEASVLPELLHWAMPSFVSDDAAVLTRSEFVVLAGIEVPAVATRLLRLPRPTMPVRRAATALAVRARVNTGRPSL
jgi:Histidine kinase-, DNA gyrase B-, and HSP90-like ATPase